MYKRFLLSAFLASAVGSAVGASVDVNTADEPGLRTVKGIGPAKARAIVAERTAHGPFKDAADLAARVRGLGGATLERLQDEGLTIGEPPLSLPARGAPCAARAPARTAVMAVA